MNQLWNDFWGAVIAAVVSAISWLIVRIIQMDARFKELHAANDLLRSEIKYRDKLREADREDLAEVKSDVREIRNAILGGNR